MSKILFVINPNSLPTVTQEVDRALEPFRKMAPLPIQCLELIDGPPGIQSQRDVDGIVAPLLSKAAELEPRAAAFVVACFSDPGLFALREQSQRPVFGIAECGVLTALTLGHRFGVISILPASVPRHLRYFGAMGIRDRLARDRALNLSVAELADETRAFTRMKEVGRTLRDIDGADVILLGCAGMARFRAPLEEDLGIQVVEPTQAAVGFALGRILTMLPSLDLATIL